jgi:phosphate transport system protein
MDLTAMSIRASFDTELQALLDTILRLGSRVDSAIGHAIRALKTNDTALAGRIVAEDETINTLRFEIEDKCLSLIARQQPTGPDLRLIVATMNIALDLERMGDHAAGIASIVLRMDDVPLPRSLYGLTHMASIAQEMLRHSLDALIARNPEDALLTCARDEEVERLYNQVSNQIISGIGHDAGNTPRAAYLLFCAYSVRRFADLVTNICERVVFLVTGRLAEFGVQENPHTVAPLG